jgi:hypothetical protein
MKVRCYCSECEGRRPQVTMTTFESHGGRASKKPKQSIRVRTEPQGSDTAVPFQGQSFCGSMYSLWSEHLWMAVCPGKVAYDRGSSGLGFDVLSPECGWALQARLPRIAMVQIVSFSRL